MIGVKFTKETGSTQGAALTADMKCYDGAGVATPIAASAVHSLGRWLANGSDLELEDCSGESKKRNQDLALSN